MHKPPKVRTTIPAEDTPPLPDLLDRRFDPGAPDVAWVGDITYIPTGEVWLYLASGFGGVSRRGVGSSMAAAEFPCHRLRGFRHGVLALLELGARLGCWSYRTAYVLRPAS